MNDQLQYRKVLWNQRDGSWWIKKAELILESVNFIDTFFQILHKKNISLLGVIIRLDFRHSLVPAPRPSPRREEFGGRSAGSYSPTAAGNHGRLSDLYNEPGKHNGEGQHNIRHFYIPSPSHSKTYKTHKKRTGLTWACFILCCLWWKNRGNRKGESKRRPECHSAARLF